VRDDEDPGEGPATSAGPPPAAPHGEDDDQDGFDVPEWVSEFRRLYVEPKTRAALKDQSARRGRAGALPVPPAGGSGRSGATASTGQVPEQPLADEPLRSRSAPTAERRSRRGGQPARRAGSAPPTRDAAHDAPTSASDTGSRAAMRRAREERARAERRMRLRRTVVVGVLLLVVAAVITWVVSRTREPVSASPAALVSTAVAPTPAPAAGTAAAAARPAADDDGVSGTGGGRAQPLVQRRATVPVGSDDRPRDPGPAQRRSATATSIPTPTPTPTPTASPRPVARGTGSFTWVRWGEVPGTREVGGQVVRVALEVEGGLGLDERETARTVARILVDERGWQTERDVRFVFVTPGQAERGDYDTRIGIASRRTTTELCAPLETEGFTSCYNGRVVINLDRWMLGVDAYEGRLDEYRTYVVDHEVGHALGLGHDPCPEKGAPAPVMVPQTLHLWGCLPNPYPVVG
jgi:hypothetical protein